MKVYHAILVLLVVLAVAPADAAAAATFVVDSSLDASDASSDGVCDDGSGNCTLRAAIQEANALGGADSVTFAIAGTGSHTITLAAPLPTVSGPVTIDGTTQTGSSLGDLWGGVAPTWNVVVNCNNQDNNTDVPVGGCLRLMGGDSTIKGVEIHSTLSTETVAGCIVVGGGDNTVEGVYGHGCGSAIVIEAGSSGDTVTKNLLSDNDHEAVVPNGDEAVITDNFMGTDVSGMAAGVAYANRSDGIYTGGGGNQILRNLIGGCVEAAIELRGTGGNTVQGNYIGVTRLGEDITNDCLAGININGDDGNLIGGPLPADRNVIGRFDLAGILLMSEASSNTVQGNYIGVGPNGGSPLGSGNGIVVVGGAMNTLIGGITGGAENVIANATPTVVSLLGITTIGAGILLFDPTAGGLGGDAGDGNGILRNSIRDNAGRGIHLSDAVPANDTFDGDGGPNNLVNFPVLSAATTTGTATSVAGSLSSIPLSTYRLEFFASSVADSSGYGEGETYIGSIAVTTDGNGDASLSTDALLPIPVGYAVSATASQDLGGGVFSTSEFSAALTTTPPTTPPASTPSPQAFGATLPPGVNFHVDAAPSTQSAEPLSHIDALAVSTLTPALAARDLSSERAALRLFTRLFPRLPSSADDWFVLHHLAYGDRIPRDLHAERAALPIFFRLFAHLPEHASDWRILHVLARSGP